MYMELNNKIYIPQSTMSRVLRWWEKCQDGLSTLVKHVSVVAPPSPNTERRDTITSTGVDKKNKNNKNNKKPHPSNTVIKTKPGSSANGKARIVSSTSGHWNEDEEKRFNDALQKYSILGLDSASLIDAIEIAVGTRDRRQIRSHLQVLRKREKKIQQEQEQEQRKWKGKGNDKKRGTQEANVEEGEDEEEGDDRSNNNDDVDTGTDSQEEVVDINAGGSAIEIKAAAAPIATISKASTIAKGTRVWARFFGSEEWYPGKVVAVLDSVLCAGQGKFHVLFDDGDRDEAVQAQSIRRMERAEEGAEDDNEMNIDSHAAREDAGKRKRKRKSKGKLHSVGIKSRGRNRKQKHRCSSRHADAEAREEDKVGDGVEGEVEGEVEQGFESGCDTDIKDEEGAIIDLTPSQQFTLHEAVSVKTNAIGGSQTFRGLISDLHRGARPELVERLDACMRVYKGNASGEAKNVLRRLLDLPQLIYPTARRKRSAGDAAGKGNMQLQTQKKKTKQEERTAYQNKERSRHEMVQTELGWLSKGHDWIGAKIARFFGAECKCYVGTVTHYLPPVLSHLPVWQGKVSVAMKQKQKRAKLRVQKSKSHHWAVSSGSSSGSGSSSTSSSGRRRKSTMVDLQCSVCTFINKVLSTKCAMCQNELSRVNESSNASNSAVDGSCQNNENRNGNGIRTEHGNEDEDKNENENENQPSMHVKEPALFRVIYEDGDVEEIEDHEVEHSNNSYTAPEYRA